MICKWKACRDEESGYTFYWNQETGETTWDRPDNEPIEGSMEFRKLPEAAHKKGSVPRKRMNEGSIFYFN